MTGVQSAIATDVADGRDRSLTRRQGRSAIGRNKRDAKEAELTARIQRDAKEAGLSAGIQRDASETELTAGI